MSWPGFIPSIGSLLGPVDSSTPVQPAVSSAASAPADGTRFRQALAALLPQGYAWPRDPDSVWIRLIGGIADLFGEHHAFAAQTVREWQPHTTHTRLDEWEAACGLPDACFGVDQSFADRQARMVARLRGTPLAYADSSPAAPQVLVDLCAALGYPAVVTTHYPFRVGRDRTGQRLGANDGKLVLRVTVNQTAFRVGANRVGDRLIKRPPTLAQLACALERHVPARYQLNLIIV